MLPADDTRNKVIYVVTLNFSMVLLNKFTISWVFKAKIHEIQTVIGLYPFWAKSPLYKIMDPTLVMFKMDIGDHLTCWQIEINVFCVLRNIRRHSKL